MISLNQSDRIFNLFDFRFIILSTSKSHVEIAYTNLICLHVMYM